MTKSSSFCTTAAPAALRRRGARAVALAAMLLSAFVGISAARAGLPSPVVVADYGLREVGRGQLTWLGFRVYEASLWSGSGRWTGGGAEPVALSLWYQRRFSRDQLVDITTGEWERLGLAPPEARGRWTAELNRIWRDVRPGDNLTAVVVPGPAGETRFYDARGPIGRVGDPAFGPAYLAIWLDPRSAVRDLGVRLRRSGASPASPVAGPASPATLPARL